MWMLNNNITGIVEHTFSAEVDDFGQFKTIDLIPDGRHVLVVEENKRHYVQLIVNLMLVDSIKQQMHSFREGFNEIVPVDLVRLFNENELELLVSGMPDIDVDDWRNNTLYEGYTASSPQIQWFWRALRSFNQEERAKLVQFVTGTSKVPLEGFSALHGSNGINKFHIHRDYGSHHRLPSAHTCFNQLDLPAYESYDQLKNALLIAIKECNTGFGFI
jgi:E3 ubiquitin-protein ligase HUWE1